MVLRKITVENFKSFAAAQGVSCAIPSGKAGSGLTLLVGENNCGKSTILEAIHLTFGHQTQISKEERRGNLVPKVTIDFDNNGTTSQALSTTVGGGSQVVITGTPNNWQQQFTKISARRYWSHRFSNETNLDNYYNSNNNQSFRGQAEDGQLPQLLARINKTPAQRTSFNDLVKKIIPQFNDWTIDADEHGNYLEYKTKGGAVHKTRFFGEGVISVFKICAHLIDTNNRIILIDEPELSLHPQAVKRLASMIAEQASDKQIIVATHSPYFVNWNWVMNGAELVKVVKLNDDVSTTHRLDQGAAYIATIKNAVENYQSPQLMDEVAKEMFFSQRIVFLEGLEDAALVRKFIQTEGIDVVFDIFGYGVGGAGNINSFLSLAKDLNIFASAVFDGNKRTESQQTQTSFPDFMIKVLPTDDIRDKRARDPNGRETNDIAVQGMFDTKGQIKADHKAKLTEILGELNTHLRGRI